VHRARLDDIVELVAAALHRPPRTIVDIGSGTGTGTVALARRFVDAELIAVDNDPRMLERVRNAATEAGAATRIRTMEADLDDRWPDVGDVDLIWAALSLHHIADPDRLFRSARSALTSGGLLAAVEMDGLPRFLPDDIGLGRPGLESRCHALASGNGWNEHPNWTEYLHRAGFEVLEERRVDIDLDPAPDGTVEYATLMLERMRTGIGDRLDPDDRATLDRLLDPGDPAALRNRRDLSVRGSRTVWTARPTPSPTMEGSER